MISSAVWKSAGVDEGAKLPAFAWPGGYPLRYICEDGEAICPDCVNKVREYRWLDHPEWNIIAVDVHWEGPSEWCFNCGTEIPSAYGDPDEEEQTYACPQCGVEEAGIEALTHITDHGYCRECLRRWQFGEEKPAAEMETNANQLQIGDRINGRAIVAIVTVRGLVKVIFEDGDRESWDGLTTVRVHRQEPMAKEAKPCDQTK